MNVTSLNPRLINWLSRKCNHHIVVIQEHKLMGHKLAKAKKNLGFKYQVIITSARIKVAGLSAGVAILVRRGVAISPEWTGLTTAESPFWTSTIVRIKNCSIALVCMYLPPDEAETNLSTMHEVSTFIQSIQCPFLICADFNKTPDQLIAMEWPPTSRGIIRTPCNSEITCMQGKGSMIDYAVMSHVLEHMMDPTYARDDIPIKTHMAIEYSIKCDPMKVMIDCLVSPKNIPDSGEKKLPAWEWSRCQEACIQVHPPNRERRPQGCQAQYATMIDINEEAEKASDMYRKWSRTNEIHILSQERPVNDHKKYLGRGEPPIIKKDKVLPSKPPEHCVVNITWQTLLLIRGKIEHLRCLIKDSTAHHTGQKAKEVCNQICQIKLPKQ